ncbi:MAG: transposase [Methylocella sp.]
MRKNALRTQAENDQAERRRQRWCFIAFLKRLITGAVIFLSGDRGPAHCAKKSTALVETPGGKLRLYFLPPYSPDRNRYELAWKPLEADTVGGVAQIRPLVYSESVRSFVFSLYGRRER